MLCYNTALKRTCQQISLENLFSNLEVPTEPECFKQFWFVLNPQGFFPLSIVADSKEKIKNNDSITSVFSHF